MISEVTVENLQSQPMATVLGSSIQRDLSQNIKRFFDEFYANPPTGERGLNIVYYHGAPDRDLFANGGEMLIECGVLMAAGNGATPAGRVVTVAYHGSYDGLGEAYDALSRYCAEHKLARAGPFWEVYGHWNDDPAKLRTDVFQLLK